MENNNLKIEELLNKVNKLKETEKIDLSSKEDLAIGIMNLISIEEHLYFSYEKTNDENFLKLLNEVREVRKNLLQKIVKNPKGEIWCISKHLLAASMRFMEVGTKKLNENKEEESKDLFDKAYQLWNIFWGLNLNLIEIKDLDNQDEKNTDMISIPSPVKRDEGEEGSKNVRSSPPFAAARVNEVLFAYQKDDGGKTENVSLFAKLGSILQKILDCCRE